MKPEPPEGDAKMERLIAEWNSVSSVEKEVRELRAALAECLPYLSTRRSVGEIEAREKALRALGIQETEPAETPEPAGR
jgi:hypothetical protein